jgi:hypothetical protein
VEKKLPDNINEIQNDFIQECGRIWEKNNELHLQESMWFCITIKIMGGKIKIKIKNFDTVNWFRKILTW